MKKLIMMLLLFCCAKLKAQTVQEFLQQNKTQKKYLVQQIVALKVLQLLTKKTTSLTGKGWKATEVIKTEDKKQYEQYLKKEGYETEAKNHNHNAPAGS